MVKVWHDHYGERAATGDHLFPFLFVLFTEALTHHPNKAEQKRVLKGIQFSSDGPAVHHLLFANDNLFLCKTKEDQSSILKQILKVYGEAPGQVINLDKLSTIFGALIETYLTLKVQRLWVFSIKVGQVRFWIFLSALVDPKWKCLDMFKIE